MDQPHYSRPAMPGDELFDSMPGDEDPALRAEAGARVAQLLVRGARDRGDAEIVERIVRLADDHGLDLLAELWRHEPADSLAGALWRLYLLRTWVHSDPAQAAREFDAGRAYAPVDEVVAGVVEPPGPREVCELVDAVLRGLAVGDLPVTLERAAAFARIVALGRVHLDEEAAGPTRSAARLVDTAEQLESSARLERSGALP
jgi:hypothetical protein